MNDLTTSRELKLVTQTELAEQWEVSVRTVRTRLAGLGIDPVSFGNSTGGRPVSLYDLEEVHEAYFNVEFDETVASVSDIAADIGVSIDTIRRLIFEHVIEPVSYVPSGEIAGRPKALYKFEEVHAAYRGLTEDELRQQRLGKQFEQASETKEGRAALSAFMLKFRQAAGDITEEQLQGMLRADPAMAFFVVEQSKQILLLEQQNAEVTKSFRRADLVFAGRILFVREAVERASEELGLDLEDFQIDEFAYAITDSLDSMQVTEIETVNMSDDREIDAWKAKMSGKTPKTVKEKKPKPKGRLWKDAFGNVIPPPPKRPDDAILYEEYLKENPKMRRPY
jgi:predicted ArsR family transcriptional regulator